MSRLLNCDGREKYELRNIMERWVLTSMNCCDDGNLLSITSIGDVINKKAVGEMVEKKIVKNKKKAKEFFRKNCISVINKFVQSPKEQVEGKCEMGKNYIKYKDFTTYVEPSRMVLFNQHRPFDVIRCALRYSTILSGSQHWGLPDDMYNTLYNEYNVRYEGYASPFNSRLMGKKDAYFCSLFEDTDKPFGSIGSFFKIKIDNPPKSKKNIGWAINPPYVESIMISTVKKITAALKSKKNIFIFYIMPEWTDSDAYTIIKNDPHVRHVEFLPKFHHYYENKGKKIVSKFKSIVFVLDNFTKNGNPYYNICQSMKC